MWINSVGGVYSGGEERVAHRSPWVSLVVEAKTGILRSEVQPGAIVLQEPYRGSGCLTIRVVGSQHSVSTYPTAKLSGQERRGGMK